jgi:hypothetical protein
MPNRNSKPFWPYGMLILGVLSAVMLAFGQDWQGEWELRPSSSPDKVRLTLREFSLGGRRSNSTDVPLKEFRNLSWSTLNGNGRADFELVRDAGRIICSGTFSNGSGSGNFKFEPNPEFGRELNRLGYSTPDEDSLLSMLILDIGLEFARGIREAGLNASTKELRDLRIHGVTMDYIRDVRSAGYSTLSARDFVQMRIHGVGADFVRDLKDTGYDLSIDEIVQLRIHGVSSDYLKELRTYGLRPAGRELTELRIHGVTPEYLRDLKNAGYEALPVKEITQLRIHGVEPQFIQETKRLGYNFTTKELVDMRIHGVDGTYLKRLRDAGFNNLSSAQIVKLRIHGVD